MRNVRFEGDGSRLTVVDEIENTRFEVYADAEIDPQPVPAEAFRFPVDGGVAFEATALEVPQFVSLYVWDRETEALDRTIDPQEDVLLTAGRYVIDLTNTPLKVYVQVSGSVEIAYTESATKIEFDGPRRVRIGARSLHEQPAGTVVTTEDPRDIMEAVSTFGSSLKTHSPDRAYPTLRGHPPEIELGDRLHVPERFEPPDTGVEIGVSTDLNEVFTVSTLAHYLGASVVPARGADPYITADGVHKPFDQGDGFEEGVRNTLERQFTFDCALRTEGIYRLQAKERDVLESMIDMDIAALFDAPLATRTAVCFELPDAALDRPSQWHLLADVGDRATDAELLPFYVSDLAHIRPESERERAETGMAEPREIEDFFRATQQACEAGSSAPALTRSTDQATRSRSATDQGTRSRSADQATRSRSTADEEGDAQNGEFTIDEVVTPPVTETLSHFWSSEYFPIGAAKATPESLRRRFDAGQTDSRAIEVTVVCNEENMREESDALYGFRDLVNLDVSVHYDLTTEELRSLLRNQIDFLHYIGHVDEEGMRCDDGAVNLKEVESVGVRAFFLNACQSYEQGLALLEAGAHGGIVTVAEVYDAIATKFGRRIARLMDAGFDLLGAMDIGQDGTLAGGSYAIVGDGRFQLCRPIDGIPILYNIDHIDGSSDTFAVTLDCYPTTTYGIGSFGSHLIDSHTVRQVFCGRIDVGEMKRTPLQPLLQERGNPLQVNGKLVWSGEIDSSDL